MHWGKKAFPDWDKDTCHFPRKHFREASTEPCAQHLASFCLLLTAAGLNQPSEQRHLKQHNVLQNEIKALGWVCERKKASDVNLHYNSSDRYPIQLLNHRLLVEDRHLFASCIINQLKLCLWWSEFWPTKERFYIVGKQIAFSVCLLIYMKKPLEYIYISELSHTHTRKKKPSEYKQHSVCVSVDCIWFYVMFHTVHI